MSGARTPGVVERAWRRRWQLGSALVTLAVVAFTFVTVIVPLWLVVVNSFKDVGAASRLGFELPVRWEAAENYGQVIEEGRVGVGLVNTLLLVIPSTFLVVLFSAAAAWVFARARSRGASTLYYVAISGILIPGAIVTSIQVLKWLGLQGSHVGLIAFYVGTNVSVGIFLITGFVKTIPIELEEAARIDGAGTFTIFRRVILPLLTPIVATLAFLIVLWLWNDFFYPFFLLPGPAKQTLMLGLFNFASASYHKTSWDLVFANVVLVSLPLILVYLLTQRWIVAGLMGVGRDK